MRRTKRHAFDFVGRDGRRYQFRVQAVTASGARSQWTALSVALRRRQTLGIAALGTFRLEVLLGRPLRGRTKGAGVA